MTIVMGCDFVLYGPIEASKEVFPAVYTLYTTYRYLLRRKELTLYILTRLICPIFCYSSKGLMFQP